MKKWILFTAVIIIIASCGYSVVASEEYSNTPCPKDTVVPAQTSSTESTGKAKVYSNSVSGCLYTSGNSGGRVAG